MAMKTLRNVKESTWKDLKALADRNRVPIGILLDVMVKDYSESPSLFWGKVLRHEKILSDDDAESIKNAVSEMRKEKGFR
ncbi:MAG: hypothetical protein J4431_04210 [Candidatus Aenigmarchaeota archaeon]|nr:hypothetical protein [Candidatus Aenigmarchaeota archaeon]